MAERNERADFIQSVTGRTVKGVLFDVPYGKPRLSTVLLLDDGSVIVFDGDACPRHATKAATKGVADQLRTERDRLTYAGDNLASMATMLEAT